MDAKGTWVDYMYKIGDGTTEGNYIQITTGDDGLGVKLTTGGKEKDYFGPADMYFNKDIAKKLGEMLIKLSSEVE